MNALRATAAATLAFVVLSAAEAGITGRWQGETDGGASLILDVTEKGAELTGTLTRDGQSTPITDGKVSKGTFTFKATLNGQSETFAGELAGEQLRIWLERQGSAKAVVLTRVKAQRG